MIQVLCAKNRKNAIIERLFLETTSIGIRYYDVCRRILERDQVDIETTFGLIAVKRVKYPDGNVRFVPEYEVCKKIAYQNNIPIKTVYETITREAAAMGSDNFSDG